MTLRTRDLGKRHETIVARLLKGMCWLARAGTNRATLALLTDLQFRQRSDATNLEQEAPCILMHVISDALTWGLGFTQAIESRWPHHAFAIASRLRALNRANLGDVIWSPLGHGIEVAHLVVECSRSQRGANLDIPALHTSLHCVAERALALGVSVHCPPLGTGLSSAPWDTVHAVIQQELVDRGIPVVMHLLGSQMPAERS